jgi:3-oxoadipate enol-lactonase
LRDADFTAKAKDINVPTLFIAGTYDGSTPPALVEASAGHVPGSIFKLIKGVAHIPCVEQPEAYASLLQEFAS